MLSYLLSWAGAAVWGQNPTKSKSSSGWLPPSCGWSMIPWWWCPLPKLKSITDNDCHPLHNVLVMHRGSRALAPWWTTECDSRSFLPPPLLTCLVLWCFVMWLSCLLWHCVYSLIVTLPLTSLYLCYLQLTFYILNRIFVNIHILIMYIYFFLYLH